MRIISSIIIGFLFTLSPFFSTRKDNSIYSKEIVYTYNYSIVKNGKSETGKLYLGCLGKLWPIKEQKQYAIIWTKEIKILDEKSWQTGVIEDSSRIFMHPPRINEFKILEYSPFPYVKFPLKTKNSWDWKLALGKFWENKELNVLANDTLHYNYQIVKKDQKYFSFAKSMLTFHVIKSHSINPKFKSEFVGHFSENYGFLYCQFQNIDNSIITLELININSFDEILSNVIKGSDNKILWENKLWK